MEPLIILVSRYGNKMNTENFLAVLNKLYYVVIYFTCDIIARASRFTFRSTHPILSFVHANGRKYIASYDSQSVSYGPKSRFTSCGPECVNTTHWIRTLNCVVVAQYHSGWTFICLHVFNPTTSEHKTFRLPNSRCKTMPAPTVI